MSKNDSKNSTNEGDEEELTVVEGFQVNILDLVTFYNSLTKKITTAGAKTPCSGAIFDAAHVYVKSRNSTELITNFIEKSWRDWEHCPGRDEDTLYKNVKALFPAIPDSHLLSIRQLFDVTDSKGKKIVTQADKDSVWIFIIELIRMAIMYIHSERCWGKKPDGKIGYTKVFFKDISVSKYADLFDVGISK